MPPLKPLLFIQTRKNSDLLEGRVPGLQRPRNTAQVSITRHPGPAAGFRGGGATLSHTAVTDSGPSTRKGHFDDSRVCKALMYLSEERARQDFNAGK